MNLIQAPTPFSEDKALSNELILTKKPYDYNLVFNNDKSFNIKIFLNEEKKLINISAILNEEYTYFEYVKLLSLDELITKNKQFKTFDYINEAYNLIIKLFEKNKIAIKEYIENIKIILEIKLLSLS